MNETIALELQPKQFTTDVAKPLAESKLVAQIFITLHAVFGHKWSSQYPTEKAVLTSKEVWRRALSGLSEYQIGVGITTCAKHTGWPPSTGEFIRMCLDLPTEGEAVGSVMKKRVIDPVVRNIMLSIGSWDLQHCSANEVSRMAHAYYDSALSSAVSELEGLGRPWTMPEAISLRGGEGGY